MNRQASSHTERRPTEGQSKPRLLVVEDEPHVRVLMEHMLRDRYRVDLAADAEAAIACAEQAKYDGLLIDITLRSERNGIDVLEHLRAQSSYRATPMVAITAHALPGDRERFLSAGFDAYLSKPFKRDALHRTLARLIPQPRATRSADRRISQNARPVNA